MSARADSAVARHRKDPRRERSIARRAAVLLVAALALTGCRLDPAAEAPATREARLAGPQVDLLLMQAQTHREAGDTERALAEAAQALAGSIAIADERRMAFAHRALAAVARDREDSVGELDHQLASLHGFARLGDLAEVAEAERGLVSFYLLLDLSLARRYAESALATFRKLEDRKGIAAATGSLGQVEFESGNVGSALELFEQAVQRSRELGYRDGESANLSRMSYAYWKLARPAEMLDVLERALDLVRPDGNQRVIVDLRTDIGLAKLELGRDDEGRRDLESALELAEALGATRQQIVVLAYLSRAYEVGGDSMRALAAERRRSALHRQRFSDQLNLQIASAQSRGDLQRQAIETERLQERDRRRSWTLGVVSVLSLVLVASLGAVAWIRHRAARKIEFKSGIIELKSAELARTLALLREKEAEARRLFENTGEGIASVDFEERFLVANPAAERIFGVASGELVGRSLFDFLDETSRSLVVEQTALRRRGERATYELEVVREAGERVRVLVTAAPQSDAEGSPVGTLGVFRDITEERRSKIELRRANEELAAIVGVLRLRDRQLVQVNALNELLLGCATRAEAFQVIEQSAIEVLRGEPGSLAMFTAGAEDELAIVASWGARAETEPARFSRDSCWAIRRGQPHIVTDLSKGLTCAHLKQRESGTGSACIPLVVRGELLGLLSVYPPNLESGVSAAALRAALAEAIKLGLSNLMLRESLEEQAVRDPLTGLFNRRFLDASLPREIDRARRLKLHLTCAMLDLDRFKRFNNEFGHDAGDLILREVGRVLRSGLRSTDLACRIGGDEFVIILPESSLANARQRLEQISRRIALGRLIHLGRALDPISTSVGLAEVPAHGTNAEDLLRAADHALLAAKQQGKDRIAAAEGGENQLSWGGEHIS